LEQSEGGRNGTAMRKTQWNGERKEGDSHKEETIERREEGIGHK
jgi:hypothetical protein